MLFEGCGTLILSYGKCDFHLMKLGLWAKESRIMEFEN